GQTQSARTTRARLSLQENTAERSPPLSLPEGTAITSLSKPARSRERCALSLPAHSSMQPKGRIGVMVQSVSVGAIFLAFITSSMPKKCSEAQYFRTESLRSLAQK